MRKELVRCESKSQPEVPSLYLYGMCNVDYNYYIFGGHTFFPSSEMGKCSHDLLIYRPECDEFCVIEEEVQAVTRRSSPTFVYRKSKNFGNSLILFGGWSQFQFSNQLYEYSLRDGVWRELVFKDQPHPVSYHSSLYYEKDDQMIVFGGVEDLFHEGEPEHWKRLNRMYICDFRLQKWFDIPPQKYMCSERGGHTGEWRTKHKFMIIFGRKSLFEFLNDVWQYDMRRKNWTLLRCTGTLPAPRSSHSSIVVKKRNRKYLYVFGGGVTTRKRSSPKSTTTTTSSSDHHYHQQQRSGEYYNDLHSLDLKSLVWTKVDLSGSIPRATYGQKSGFYVCEKDSTLTMFVYGGIGSGGSSNQLIHFKIDKMYCLECREIEKKIGNVMRLCTENPSELIIQEYMKNSSWIKNKNKNNNFLTEEIEEEEEEGEIEKIFLRNKEEEEEKEEKKKKSKIFRIFPYMLDKKIYNLELEEKYFNVIIPDSIDKELFLTILFGEDVIPEDRLEEYCRIYNFFMTDLKLVSYCFVFCEKIRKIRRTSLLISFFEVALMTLEDEEEKLTGVNFKSALTLEIFICLMYKVKEILKTQKFRDRMKRLKYMSKLLLMTPSGVRSHPDFLNKSFVRSNSFKNVCMRTLRSLYDSKKWANLVLKSKEGKDNDNNEILVHKEILMIRSEFFYRMFRFPGKESSEKKIVVIELLNNKSLSALIHFIYTSEIDKSFCDYDTLFSLMRHSDMFFEEDLKFAVFLKIHQKIIREVNQNVAEVNERRRMIGSSQQSSARSIIHQNLLERSTISIIKKNLEMMPITIITQFKRYLGRKWKYFLFCRIWKLIEPTTN